MAFDELSNLMETFDAKDPCEVIKQMICLFKEARNNKNETVGFEVKNREKILMKILQGGSNAS